MNCTKCGNALPESESPFCPFCGEQQEAATDAADNTAQAATTAGQAEEEIHPLTAKAMAGKPVDGAAADSTTSGSFSAAPAGGQPMGQAPTPFGAPPAPEKKRLPGWAIALIAGGVVFVLAICCCIAAIVIFADDEFDSAPNEFDTGTIERIVPPIDDDANGDDTADVPPVTTGAISFGDTFEFDNLEIVFGTAVRWATIDASWSDHHGAEIFQVPITVTNIGNETASLNMFSFTQFAPDGNSQDFVSFLLVDDDITTAGSMRPGGTQNAYMTFLFEGDGEYVVEFSELFSSTAVEVVLPITQP